MQSEKNLRAWIVMVNSCASKKSGTAEAVPQVA